MRTAGLTGRHHTVLLCPADTPGGQIGSVAIPGMVLSAPEHWPNGVRCCGDGEGARVRLSREVSAVLGSTQPGEKTQQSLAEGRGSRRVMQTLLILNDTEAKRYKGAEEPSARLMERQDTGLQPPASPRPGRGVMWKGNWIPGFTE